jgi:GT2 family glycosyltransferase/2-polyprenyl-3-methyl-5-hydroxy-6-metoxy-1,4-benzoquinol methylase
VKNIALFSLLWDKNAPVLEQYLAGKERTVILLAPACTAAMRQALEPSGAKLVALESVLSSEERESIFQDAQQRANRCSEVFRGTEWPGFCLSRGFDSERAGAVISDNLSQKLFAEIIVLAALNKVKEEYFLELIILNEDVLPISKTIALWAHTERIPVLHLTHGLGLPRPNTVDEEVNADVMAVFGRRGGEFFLDAGIPAERIRVTGSPSLDIYQHLKQKRELIRQYTLAKNNLLPEFPIVVFGTTWAAHLTAISDGEVYEKSLRHVLLACRQAADEGVIAQLIIKDRPANSSFGPELCRRITLEVGFPEQMLRYVIDETEIWVAAADVVISIDSNLSAEAALAGVPAINLMSDAGLRLGPSFYGDSGIVEVEPEGLKNAIVSILADDNLKNILITASDKKACEYNAENDGMAVERVALLMEEVARIPSGLANVKTYKATFRQAGQPPLPPGKYVWESLTEGDDSSLKMEGYTDTPRSELIGLFQHKPRRVLDIGCNMGSTGELIKREFPTAEVIGIEVNKAAADVAGKRIDRVINEPIDTLDWMQVGIEPHSIDTVILADVLEHFIDPWGTLRKLIPILTPDAQVVSSIPNSRNLWLMDRLAQGLWTYQQVGLLDVTHIRFFTLDEMKRMFDETGYEIVKIGANRDGRIVLPEFADESVTVETDKLTLKNVSPAEAFELKALQFLLVARPRLLVEDGKVLVPDQRRKLRCTIFSIDFPPAACATLRLSGPLGYLANDIDIDWRVTYVQTGDKLNYSINWDGIYSADLIIIQRWIPREQFKDQIEKILTSGKVVIYETDDLLDDIPQENSHHQYSKNNRDILLNVISRAHAVTVSTKTLRNYYLKYNPNVFVVPNLLNETKWADLHIAPPHDEVVIGFAGGNSHEIDLALVEEALERIADKYGNKIQFRFVGCTTEKISKLPNYRYDEFYPGYAEYSLALKEFNFDVAISPLKDTFFNQCKSNIKWLEYSVAGMPGVYSNVAPYRESIRQFETGVLVENTSDAWFEALDYLISHPEVREKIASDARREVLEHYTYASQAGKIKDLYWKIIEKNAISPVWQKPDEQYVSKEKEQIAMAYRTWLHKHSLQEIDAQLFAERMVLKWKQRPKMHFVMRVYAGEEKLLADTINSLSSQMYSQWMLSVIADLPCTDPIFEQVAALRWKQFSPEMPASDVFNQAIAEVDADWIGLISPGVRFEPHLLLVCGDYVNIRPQWKLIYTDEDSITQQGERLDPKFKPDFNLDLLRSMPYLGAFCLVNREALIAVGGCADLPEAESYDLALKILDSYGESSFGHISDVLCHVPEKGYRSFNGQSGTTALQVHLARCGELAEVTDGYLPATFRVLYRHDAQPMVSIIIPTRDKIEFLRPCVESLLEKTAYPSYELLIIDNQSVDPDVFEFYDQLLSVYPEKIRILHYDQPFNFSAICNFGAKQARGELILLLNNDTRVIHGEWLERMVSHAMRPGIGVVGARLIDSKSSRIQHAGVILGINSVADHIFAESSKFSDSGYMGRAQVDQNFSAVTAACMLIPRAIYDEVGGMDESNLPVLFNDVDLCLKIGARGYKIVCTPYASLIHDAHNSLQDINKDPEKAALSIARARRERDFMYRHWLPTLANDPAYNRHLSLTFLDCRAESDIVIDWDVNFHDRPRIVGVPLPGGSGEYRLVSPFRALSIAGLAQTNIVQTAKMSETRVLTTVELERTQADSLVLHAPIDDIQMQALETYKKYNQQLRIFMLDDLITNPPQQSSFFKKSFRDAKFRLRNALSFSDRLIVTTQPLADLCQGMIEDIRILPNMLEKEYWGKVTSKRRQSVKPRVGWAGAQQHQGDLRLIIDAVKSTAGEVDWIFFGMCLDELKPYVKEIHGFQLSHQDYISKLASLNLDLAVAPLEIHPFNEAKSNLRLLEYGYLGWPVICSDIYPYQTAPVKHVSNEPHAWIAAIRERIHDLDAAQAEGDRLRQWVVDNYMLEDHLDAWMAALVRA